MARRAHAASVPVERLTGPERRRLRQLERIIDRNLNAWIAVGNALAEIQERKLYRDTHPTFELFVAERFGVVRRTAYAWTEAARVLAVHPDAHHLTQSHLRLLAPLDQDEQAALIPRLRGTTVKQARAQVADLRARNTARHRPTLPHTDATPNLQARLQLLSGDALQQLRQLPSASVACCVTSPPYWQKRSYSGLASEIGHEPTVDGYVTALTDVFDELHRVLHPRGTFWLVLGDSYGSRNPGPRRQIPHGDRRRHSSYAAKRTPLPTSAVGPCPPGSHRNRKQLMLIPARVALALQQHDWHLRAEVIWAKPAPTPESVRDRPTSSHEHIFLFVKDRHAYHYDRAAAAQPRTTGDGTRNLHSVWTIPAASHPQAHYAVMPLELAARCISAGSSAAGVCPTCGAPHLPHPDTHTSSRRRAPALWKPSCRCKPTTPTPSTIIDPFAGIGTTALAALQLGRATIAIELNPTYVHEIRKRINETLNNTPGAA